MALKSSPEALEATFSELTHLLIVPNRLIIEPVKLGVGGFGAVYLATLKESSGSPRKVAVKQLLKVLASVDSQRTAFRLARELKVWAKVEHPNILELIGYYISEDYLEAQLVSAFMVNGNVMEYIQRSHVSADTRLKLVQDIATGLKYLHEFSPPICHGDLKPANVLVNGSLNAVLCDFGISSFIHESNVASGLTTSESRKGSLRYTSPELIFDDNLKHSLQSDVWAWGCTAFEITTEIIPYSTESNYANIVLKISKKSAPGPIDALKTVIPGPGVDPARHPEVSSLWSIIPQCWDFDPTQRPPAARILQCTTISYKPDGILGASVNQEGGISSRYIQDDPGHGGGASQEQTYVAPYRTHTLCMNCQQYPQVGGRDFCSDARLDNASSRLSASAQSNSSSQRSVVPNFSNLSSTVTYKLNPPHSMRAGLSKEREPISQENGIARQNQEKSPQAVDKTIKFYPQTASPLGKNADKDTATSPTTSDNSDLGGALQNTSQARHAGTKQVTPSRERPKQNENSGARNGPFNTLTEGASEDPQLFAHQHQPSILRRIFSLGRFRLPKTPGQAPFPPLTSVQYRQKIVPDEGFEPDVGPTELKPATNAASSETNISTASNVQGSMAIGTDIRRSETSGREMAVTTPPAARLPTPRTTRKARPHTVAGGFKSVPVIPGLPTTFNPEREFFLELQGLLSASGKLPKRLDALNHTGKLTERTKPKFTGSFSDISQAKLGDSVVAVKALRLTNIGRPEESRMWRRLAREVHVWATLDHPNVLGLLGFAIENGIPCLISPWCDNGTLKEYLQKFPDASRRRLVREIAEGLRYLHLQTPPIIHGDLKTTNVFLRTGITPGSVPSTTRYNAPEIIRDGEDATLFSDVFSFAYVALETMTGKGPFWKMRNDGGIATQVVVKKQMPSPEDHTGMEDATWEILRKCWNYEPSDRPHMVDVCKMLSAAGYVSLTGFYPPTRAGPSHLSKRFDRPDRGTSTV